VHLTVIWRFLPGERGLTQFYKEGIRSAVIMLKTDRTKFSSPELVYP